MSTDRRKASQVILLSRHLTQEEIMSKGLLLFLIDNKELVRSKKIYLWRIRRGGCFSSRWSSWNKGKIANRSQLYRMKGRKGCWSATWENVLNIKSGEWRRVSQARKESQLGCHTRKGKVDERTSWTPVMVKGDEYLRLQDYKIAEQAQAKWSS